MQNLTWELTSRQLSDWLCQVASAHRTTKTLVFKEHFHRAAPPKKEKKKVGGGKKDICYTAVVPGAATYLLLLPLQDFSRDLMLISKKRESCRLSMVRAGRSGAPAAPPPPPAAAGGPCRCRCDAEPGGRLLPGPSPPSPPGPAPGPFPPPGCTHAPPEGRSQRHRHGHRATQPLAAERSDSLQLQPKEAIKGCLCLSEF